MRECTREDGILTAIAGATRWGKTWWLSQQIKEATRVIVWDPRGEYVKAGCELIRSLPELAEALRDTLNDPGRFAYWGPLEDFPTWAAYAYQWGQYWPGVFVVEEVSDVTGSGGGRGAWGELIRKGLYYGNHIFAVTQRPQETDKTTWGNASVKHCHHLDLPLDQEYMGKILGVDPVEIGRLKRHEYFEKISGEDGVFRGFTDPLPPQ